jgi:hypothetical protein
MMDNNKKGGQPSKAFPGTVTTHRLSLSHSQGAIQTRDRLSLDKEQRVSITREEVSQINDTLIFELLQYGHDFDTD